MNLIIKAPQFFTRKTLKGKTDTQTKNKSKNNPNYHQLKAKTIENSRKKKKTLFVCGCFFSSYCIVSLFHADGYSSSAWFVMITKYSETGMHCNTFK